MRVGLLISQLNKGGAERVVSRLTKILSEDCEVYLILFEDSFMEYEYDGKLINMNVKASENKLLRPFNFMKRIHRLINVKRKYKLDIVISFLMSPNFVNVLANVSCCRTAVSIRNYSAYENTKLESSFVTNLIKRIYNKADYIIPVSKVIANSYIESIGIERKKMHVIYNPYDISVIEKLSKEEIEQEIVAFIDSGFTYVTVGRQMYQKGYWHLIKALKIANEGTTKFNLLVIGRDYSNGKLKKLVEELGLSENVLFLGQKNNPFKYIVNCKVFVLTSLFEGFPNSLVEAMACGCPVLSTDCKSGPREILCKNGDILHEAKIIEEADFGILVPSLEFIEDWCPNNYTDKEYMLSKAMIMYTNTEVLEKYKKLSKNRANDFNEAICKKAYLKLIDSERYIDNNG